MQELLMQNMEQTLEYVAGKAKEKVGVGTGALRADTRSLGVEMILGLLVLKLLVMKFMAQLVTV